MSLLKNYYPNILVVLQFGIIGIMILFGRHFFATPYPLALFALGATLGVWALRHNQLGNFNIQPKLKENSKLVTTGIYGYIRHPMYSSVILMMSALVLANPTIMEILLFLMLILVLWLKAKREERLWSGHDKEYIEYQKRSKFFIPLII
jgi:protein-S-isoprenylcysteine O-methyltransferase Ste14